MINGFPDLLFMFKIENSNDNNYNWVFQFFLHKFRVAILFK